MNVAAACGYMCVHGFVLLLLLFVYIILIRSRTRILTSRVVQTYDDDEDRQLSSLLSYEFYENFNCNSLLSSVVLSACCFVRLYLRALSLFCFSRSLLEAASAVAAVKYVMSVLLLL